MFKKNTKKAFFGIMLAVLFVLPTMITAFYGNRGNPTAFQGADLATNAYSATEDFESYTAGDNMNGKSGPLGDWTTTITGTGCETSRAYNDGGNLVMDAMDDSTSGATSAKVVFDVNGAINGVNIVTWRQRVLSDEFNVVLWEGTSARVQIQFSGANLVRYYAPSHGGLISTGLTIGSGWETYEALLYSTSQFKLRQYKAAVWSNWTGPLDLYAHWSSSGAVCSGWDIDGSTVNMPHVYFDDVAVNWYDATPPAIAVNSPIDGALLDTGNVPLNVEVVDGDLDSIWYRLDGGSSILMPTNTSITVADGPHSIAFYANDTLGLVSSAARSFIVDTAAPVVAISSPLNGTSLFSATVNVIFTATDLTKDETWYTVNGGVPTAMVGSSFLLALADGTYTIVVCCNDSLGRISSGSVTFTIDGAPIDYSAMEDFESYIAGDDVNGKSGPLGDWTTAITGTGCETSRVYNDGGNLVMDVMDDSTSGATSDVVYLDVNGTINGVNIVTWRQRIVSDEFNVAVWEGYNWDTTSTRVQVQFSGTNQVRYYAPDHGGLINTGLTCGSGWETYEVMLYSTTQFMLRQYKSGAWSSWVGPFDLRNHWSGTGAICSAWELGGSTLNMPHVYIDDVAVNWYDDTPPAITVNSPINGALLDTNNVPLNVEVVDDDLDSVWYRIDGGSSILMPTNTSITVADGSHSITFYANDTLGHLNSVARTFTVDTNAPVVDITFPASGSNLTYSFVMVSFTATDLTKDKTWYTVDGGLPVLVSGSSFLVSLPDGPHVIDVYCNDSLGRNSSDSVGFTIDSAPIDYTAMEDFESYTAADDMNGKSGPLGDWITFVTGVGSYCRVYNDSGNLVMDAMDGSISGGTSSKVSFDVNGTINGASIVTWRQRIFSDEFNVVLWEGPLHVIPSARVQVQFSGTNQVRYYAPDHGGLINTGLTFGSGWETYEIMLYSTSQFMLRQFKSGAWSSWVGPFELRYHWSSTGPVCSAWDIDGSTENLPHVYFDDVGVSWYNATAPAITVNNPIDGALLDTNNITLNVKVVDSDLDSIWYRLDGGSSVLMPTNTSITVVDGPHSITFYANDTHGHLNSISRSFTVDTDAPVVEITSPLNGASLSGSMVNVTFTAIDLTKDEVWCTVNGGAPATVTGSSFLLDLIDGTFTIVVYCSDGLGRISSDLVTVTIDATDPSIFVSGFAGLYIEQGDVEYLNWTLVDAHPLMYALHLNGQVVRSGTYSSGSQVSVQIDSSTIGPLNYTLIVQDTFGNVQHHERLISVVDRTDGGIFLTIGINIIYRNGANSIELTLNMSHWTVLYLNVAFSVTTASSLLPGELPEGLVIALPVAFNLDITNTSALINGKIRVYYSQSAIANQVNEDTMVPMRWNPGTSSWVPTVSGLSRSANYVDIPLSENGLYIIAATPKQNYDPILIIVLIGLTGGIVAAAGYGYARKKSLKQKVTGKAMGKGKSTSAYSSGIPSSAIEQPVNESLAKRARLMQATAPDTSPRPSAAALFGTVEQKTGQVEAVKKKAGASTEPDVDIAARAASANKMASEVSVESIVPRCVVHKGTISGLSYTCKHCGVQYCANCAAHLAKSGEKCWNCGGAIEAEGLVPASAQAMPTLPMEGQVTVFEPEVFAKISELGIEEKLVDDLLELLKDIPANNRLQYLDDMFKETPEDEEDSL